MHVPSGCAHFARRWRQTKRRPHCYTDNKSQSRRPLFLTVWEGGGVGKKFFLWFTYLNVRHPVCFFLNSHCHVFLWNQPYCCCYQRPCYYSCLFSLFYIPCFFPSTNKNAIWHVMIMDWTSSLCTFNINSTCLLWISAIRWCLPGEVVICTVAERQKTRSCNGGDGVIKFRIFSNIHFVFCCWTLRDAWEFQRCAVCLRRFSQCSPREKELKYQI